MSMRRRRLEKGQTRRGCDSILQRVLEQATARVIADYVRDLLEELSAL